MEWNAVELLHKREKLAVYRETERERENELQQRRQYEIERGKSCIESSIYYLYVVCDNISVYQQFMMLY